MLEGRSLRLVWCIALVAAFQHHGASAQTKLESERANTLAVINQIGDVAAAVSGAPGFASTIGQVDVTSRTIVLQRGNENHGIIEAEAEPSSTAPRALLIQDGDAHAAAIAQRGAATAIVVQSGLGNRAGLMQDSGGKGIANQATILQFGSGNSVDARQRVPAEALSRGFGDENRILVSQDGERNSVSVDQHGRGNLAGIRQDGLLNSTTIVQENDDNAIFVGQTGVGLVVNYFQSGAETAPVVINQNSGAPPVTVTRSGP
ncbi:MAG: hypothetical protein AAF160_02030 [Pseudomonadota bacterium]